MNDQYLFNVLYYDYLYKNSGNDCKEQIKKHNNLLIGRTLRTADVPDLISVKGISRIKLQTVYPGLLVGTGNPHAAGDNRDEIKLGFTLDYTTGLPYIPGSTIKGVLRSVIKENDRKEAYGNRLQYLREVIAKVAEIRESDDKLSDKNLKKFELETFGKGESGKGDLFLDAYPIRGGQGDKLFAFESITPHKPFKNPIPLRLLKVIPEVVFEFRFIFKDSKIIPELTVEKKENLFKRLLMDFGVGAKTNVGFGMLEEFDGNTADDDIFYANVVGYNEKKTSAKLQCDTKQKASLFFKEVPGAEYGRIDEKLPFNTRVRIRYEGKNDNGFETWSLVEILGHDDS